MRSKEGYEATKKLHEIDGQFAYFLDVFGDTLAEREKYKEHSGMDAVHYYLIQKHGWMAAFSG